MSSWCNILLQILFLFFSNLCLSPGCLSAVRISHLPGFEGELPFHLETGYVTVDEQSGAELFYYFVESERKPKADPLVLWLVGGPYCSAMGGLALSIGPIKFKVEAYNGSLPTLVYNPYSWTKVSSIIFLDWPVGTGFSFSESLSDYATDEVQSSEQIYTFLKKWLLDNPQFLSNPFYVAGDSYGGKMTPLVAQVIRRGNEVGYQPLVNLKGYLVGNPVTHEEIDISSQALHAHGLGIISDELLEAIESNCFGQDYRNPKTAACAEKLKTLDEFFSEITIFDILEPKCSDEPPTPEEITGARRSLKEPSSSDVLSSTSVPDFDCAVKSTTAMSNLCITEPACSLFSLFTLTVIVTLFQSRFVLSYYWSNNNLTKEALHIKEETVGEWQRCRRDLNNYTYNMGSSVPYHLDLMSRGYRALVYSGDHDLDVPFIGTLEWMRSLNFSVIQEWHSWHAGGQVAGYSVLFSNNLTFATVKGGSHTPADNTPMQCFAMFERWISHELL